MKAEYRKKFLEELSKIPAQVRGDIEVFAFEEAPQLSSIAQSGKVEKLKGYTKLLPGPLRVLPGGIAARGATMKALQTAPSYT